MGGLSRETIYPAGGREKLASRTGVRVACARALEALHPRVPVPAGFPRPERVTLSLAAGDGSLAAGDALRLPFGGLSGPGLLTLSVGCGRP
jgi:hypothetical protein